MSNTGSTPAAGGARAGCAPGSGCILFVDDHGETRRAVARLLASEGYGVLTATTAASAKALLAAEPVDLLICDVDLPDGDGCELLAAARPNADADGGPPRPVRGIAVSGHTDERHEKRCRSMGFAEYLCKPVVWGELIAAIRRLV